MNFRTAKSRKPTPASEVPPDRRAGHRAAAPARTGKTFYRPKFKVGAADFLDAHFVPGYN